MDEINVKIQQYLDIAKKSYDEGDLDNSEHYYMKAYKFYNEVGDNMNEGSCYYNIGLIRMKQKEFKMAITIFLNAMDLFTLDKKHDEMGRACRKIGQCYKELGEFEHSRNYFRMAISEFRDTNNMLYLAKSFYDVGGLYYDNKKYNLALDFFKNAKDHYEEIGYSVGIAESYFGAGRASRKIDRLDDSIHYINTAIEILSGEDDVQSLYAKYYMYLGIVYMRNIGDKVKSKSNFEIAKKYFEGIPNSNDSIEFINAKIKELL